MEKQIKEIAERGIDRLMNNIGCEASELHNRLYNEDYYIIGTYQAKKWLEEYGVFEAIDKVTEYEHDNFGQITTEISQPERLLNMLVYVIGEEILNDCPTLQAKWDKKLSEKDLIKIEKEMRKAAQNYSLKC